MAKITLLLDEDVRPVLGEILRQRGYDAVHVLDAGRTGKSDAEQLAYAVSQQRTILTHNIRHFRHSEVSGVGPAQGVDSAIEDCINSAV